MMEENKKKIFKILLELIDDENYVLKLFEKLNFHLKLQKQDVTKKRKHIVIGFCGNMGVGKTTCQKLSTKFFANYKNIYSCNFADHLKYICHDLFPIIPPESFYGNQEEKSKIFITKDYKLSGRKILQVIGTDIIRNYVSENFWVEFLENKIDLITDDNAVILIGDVRFQNEYNMIKNKGGIIIKIFKNNFTSNNQHISEKINFDCDYNIFNEFNNLSKLETDLFEIIKKL